MKITFVASKLDLTGGGSNFSLELLARLLSNRGHEVSILTMQPKKNNLPQEREFDIIIPPKNRFGTRLGTQEHVYRSMESCSDETDLFHVFTPSMLSGVGLFCRQNQETPVVGQLNTYTNFCVNLNEMDGECHKSCNIRSKFKHQDARLSKRIAKLPFYASRTYIEPSLSSGLDQYFAVSPAVKEIYVEVGFPEDRITVVPDFLDPNFGLENKDGHSTQDESVLSALYVGRIIKAKGIDCLIRALARADKVQAKIVGTGEATAELQSLAADLDLHDRVHFEGWVRREELPRYYAQADVFVHPARWPEPFGRTILESFQCGTPAVVSDTGGPPWIVGDAGRTFPPGDAERLGEILGELRDNPDRIDEMQKNCQSQLERFRPENVVPKIENQYKKVTTPTKAN